MAHSKSMSEIFVELCWSRAYRWRRGEWEWIGDAVDPLQEWARTNGLVRMIGQDEVQAIMAEAFTNNEEAAESRRRDLEYDPSGRRHGLREPPNG